MNGFGRNGDFLVNYWTGNVQKNVYNFTLGWFQFGLCFIELFHLYELVLKKNEFLVS